jgi:ankyrin repeat protein
LIYAKANVSGSDGETAVVKAASAGHTATVRALSAFGAEINGQVQFGDDNFTATMAAASGGHNNTLKELFDLRADFNEESALLAAKGGHSETIQLLHSLNVKFEASKCMALAAMNGHSSTVMTIFFIIKGMLASDIEEPSEGMKHGIQMALDYAAFGGHEDTVRVVHALGANINRVSESDLQGTPILIAAVKGHAKIVKLLLQMKANVDGSEDMMHEEEGKDEGEEIFEDWLSDMMSHNKGGTIVEKLDSPLHAAAENGHREVIHVLTEFKADLHAADKEDRFVFDVAIAKCKHEVLSALYHLGGFTPALIAASENRRDDLENLKDQINVQSKFGRTPLHEAACRGHLDMVSALLEFGANINALDHLGRSPLDVASGEECSSLLMSQGADCFTKLMAAFTQGDHEAIEKLIESGCDVNACNRRKQTAVHIAAANSDEEGLKLLIMAGANLSARDYQNKTPLHLVGNENTRQLLMKHGGNGWTPLMSAVMETDEDLVKQLIGSKADVHARTESNNTPLHFAAYKKNKAILKLLIDAKAEPDTKGYRDQTAMDLVKDPECLRFLQKMGAGHWTDLMNAVADEDTERINELLAAGVDINEGNLAHRTALHVAAGLDDLTIFISLLKEGAQALLTDSEGFTPLDLAASNSFWSNLGLEPSDCFPLLCRSGGGPILRRFQGSPDQVLIRSGKLLVHFGNFSTASAGLFCPQGEKGYYELQVSNLNSDESVVQFGFCSEEFSPSLGSTSNGVGDDSCSWAVDGVRRVKWFKGSQSFGSKWNAGDVIGLACDLKERRMLIAVNGNWGQPNGQAFTFPEELNGLYPAFSGARVDVRYNFGQEPFRFSPPQDFKPFVAFEDGGPGLRCSFPVHEAVLQDRPQALAFLIKHKADVNICDVSGRTPLELAESQRCRKLLKKAGAGGWTSLMLAAARGKVDNVRKLLAERANVNASNHLGQTALHLAAAKGSLKLLELLIEYHANVTALDKEGKSAMSLLPVAKAGRCSKLLVLHGASKPLVRLFRGELEDAEISEGNATVEYNSFSTMRCWLICPPGRKAYYELEILKAGDCYQFGFCALEWERFLEYTGSGVGDDELSWGVDGQRCMLWHDGSCPWTLLEHEQWKQGDIIGLACDLECGKILASVSGSWEAPCGVVFELPDDLTGLHPAFTSRGGKLRYNFGERPFRYEMPGDGFVGFEALREFGVEELVDQEGDSQDDEEAGAEPESADESDEEQEEDDDEVTAELKRGDKVRVMFCVVSMIVSTAAFLACKKVRMPTALK